MRIHARLSLFLAITMSFALLAVSPTTLSGPSVIDQAESYANGSLEAAFAELPGIAAGADNAVNTALQESQAEVARPEQQGSNKPGADSANALTKAAAVCAATAQTSGVDFGCPGDP